MMGVFRLSLASGEVANEPDVGRNMRSVSGETRQGVGSHFWGAARKNASSK
jgi:hypothetical protein